MKIIEASAVNGLMDYAGLMDALHQAFAAEHTAPQRHMYELGDGLGSMAHRFSDQTTSPWNATPAGHFGSGCAACM